jgi:PPOX class probable F420-dependent enzyme
MLIYNSRTARRLAYLDDHPMVSMHLNTDAQGNDVVILSGMLEQADDAPTAEANEGYLDKYQDGIGRLGMTPGSFAETYSVARRFRIMRVRGF